MHRTLLICALTSTLLAPRLAGARSGQAPRLAGARSGQAQARPDPVPQPAFAEPGLAADGSEIAFVSGGDIWTVPASGGDARLLISNAANDTRPMFSPDKKHLAFVSTRTGGGDVYVLTLATSDVRRLTFDDGLEQLDGWS